MRRAGLWPLALVAVSLLALAVLPELEVRHIEEQETEIRDVLTPARGDIQELALLHARQLGLFLSYMLTGDARTAERYQALRQQEDRVSERLANRVEQADIAVREQMAALHAASQEWHGAHAGEGGPLEDATGREAYRPFIRDDLARYDRVVEASGELEAAIDAEVAAARDSMDGARRLQTRLSIALAVLALGATLAVGIVGRRLGELVNEAEDRGAEALRARREMEAVLEASADGVVGMDLDGRCTSLNRTGSELLGISDHDAVGRTVHELVHGKARGGRAHTPEECPILRALDSGIEAQGSDDVVWRRSGTSFPARWHLRPLVDGREVRGGVLTITDMTDVREAEAALRKAVRARDEMMAIVSHDLRNPLGTVSAAASLLSDIPLSPEKRDEQIEIIRRASHRMSRLIDDLLDVARIDAGALGIDPESVEVAPLIEETRAIFTPQALEAGIELEARLEGDLPPMRADRGRMEQVLSNLMGNALKFTAPGGRVDLTARRTGPWIRMSVADTGPGIAPDALTHLFDRFWQLDSGGRGGAGLGLAIVKGIVDAHGGHIRVESEVGRGTRFDVDIPVAGSRAVEGAGDGGGRGVEVEAEA